MPQTLKALALLSLLGLAGCKAHVGAAGRQIPRSAPADCSAQCHQLGMELSAMVTMADNVGCVCQPRRGDYDEEASAGVVGGMAAILIQQQAAQQQQQQQQQQAASSSY